MERKFLDFSLPGANVLTSMERKFHRSESSLCGFFASRNESAEEQKVQMLGLLAGCCTVVGAQWFVIGTCAVMSRALFIVANMVSM